MQQVTDDLWVLRYPFALLGMPMGRTVTVIRLRSGDLVIHSTGSFTASDITAIRLLGRPGWLVEATLSHDTFAIAGRNAFPGATYLAPEGFPVPGGTALSLQTIPPSWEDELEVLPLEGMPLVREHVFFHKPTRTLIVADLVFNFGAGSSAWMRRFFRVAGGIRSYPGMRRLFKLLIRDRVAFASSLQRLMQWDFDRLIVGHGEIIETDAKARVAMALAARGF